MAVFFVADPSSGQPSGGFLVVGCRWWQGYVSRKYPSSCNLETLRMEGFFNVFHIFDEELKSLVSAWLVVGGSVIKQMKEKQMTSSF